MESRRLEDKIFPVMEISQYRVRQCSKCAGDLEFVCITCQSELCQPCKENHLTDLSNKDHDVMSYRETNNLSLQERCEKHPRMIVQKYCQTCRIPSCFYCSRKHKKHRLIDSMTAYDQKRKQIVQTIHIIKHEALFDRQIMLKGIKTDISKCHANIQKNQSLMNEKAQTLKMALDNMLKYNSFVHRCFKQKNVFNTHLAWIQCFETRYEKSSYRPIDFLKNIKKVNIPHTKDSPYFLDHGIQQLTIRSFKEEVLIALLGNLKLKEKRKRNVSNDNLFKLMSSPLLQKSFLRTDDAVYYPDSLVTSDLLVVTDEDLESDVKLMNKTHETLKRLIDDLLQKCEFNTTFEWIPKCLHCSPFTGDVLVGMQQVFRRRRRKSMTRGRIDRYDHTGRLKNKGPVRYYDPLYVVENNNGDIVVSDNRSRVVGTDHEGKDRFELYGLRLYGICTDALSHTLVQVLDKNGKFLRHLLFRQPGLISPCFLAYDINPTTMGWVRHKHKSLYLQLPNPTHR